MKYLFLLMFMTVMMSCEKDFAVDDNVSKLEESERASKEFKVSDYEDRLTGDAIMMISAEEVEETNQKLAKKFKSKK